MNLVLLISPKCGQGEEGVKNPENFADVIYGWSLKALSASAVEALMERDARIIFLIRAGKGKESCGRLRYLCQNFTESIFVSSTKSAKMSGFAN